MRRQYCENLLNVQTRKKLVFMEGNGERNMLSFQCTCECAVSSAVLMSEQTFRDCGASEPTQVEDC